MTTMTERRRQQRQTPMSRIRQLAAVVPLSLFSLQQATAASSSSSVHYSTAFQNSIAPSASWPCSSPSSLTMNEPQTIASISSTAMQIDCPSSSNNIVVAAYSGTVLRISDDFIVLRHFFSGETPTVHFDDDDDEHSSTSTSTTTTKTWYTSYENVAPEQGLSVGSVVTTKQALGRVIMEKNSSDFFDFQVMVGASCTLEWARQHPLDGCNRKGYDPMVHPMILFPNRSNNNFNNNNDDNAISIDTLLPVNADLEQHGVVQVTMTRPTLNKFVIELENENEDDYNNRLELTNSQVGAFHKVGEEEWTLPLVVPYTWLNSNSNDSNNPTTTIRLSVYDAYGELVGQELVG